MVKTFYPYSLCLGQNNNYHFQYYTKCAELLQLCKSFKSMWKLLSKFIFQQTLFFILLIFGNVITPLLFLFVFEIFSLNKDLPEMVLIALAISFPITLYNFLLINHCFTKKDMEQRWRVRLSTFDRFVVIFSGSSLFTALVLLFPIIINITTWIIPEEAQTSFPYFQRFSTYIIIGILGLIACSFTIIKSGNKNNKQG